jgi:hypothetical protein
MIRVISSPSSSTTGLVTLIFAMGNRAFLELRVSGRDRSDRLSGYSTAKAAVKAEPAASPR